MSSLRVWIRDVNAGCGSPTTARLGRIARVIIIGPTNLLFEILHERICRLIDVEFAKSRTGL
jgi:hypothetical protein